MPTPSVINSRIDSFLASHHVIARALRKFRAIIDLKLVFILSFCVVGGFDACTSAAFRTDANNFSSAYGDVLNEQMLLNLARLDNGHPAYFIAVGVLTSRWSMGASATGGVSPSDTDTTTRTQNRAPIGGVLGITSKVLQTVGTAVVGRSASATVSGSVAPEFQLIPLNNEQLAQQVLTTTRPEVFLFFYNQGYPMDLLLRALVEEIRVNLGDRDLVLRNDPVGADYDSYAGFLIVCQIAHDLQHAGLLKVETKSGEFSAEGGSAINDAPDPWVVLETKKAGSKWEQTDKGKWQLGQDSSRQVFTIDKKVTEFGSRERGRVFDQLRQQYAQRGDKYVGYFDTFANLLKEGAITVGSSPPERTKPPVSPTQTPTPTPSPSTSESPTTTALAAVSPAPNASQQVQARIKPKQPAEKGPNATLVLRSYSRVLHAVAREQNNFESVYNHTQPRIPEEQMHPVIKTKGWDSLANNLERPIGAVRYAGTHYVVTDLKEKDEHGNWKTWNRDVFRLLVALNSQVAVDISKFQRQVLEVR